MKHIIIFFILLFPIVALAGEGYQGLWIGQIELTDVSEITDYTTPKPVKHVFDMTILLHVDNNNDVNLLRHVTVMKKKERKFATINGDPIPADIELPEFPPIGVDLDTSSGELGEFFSNSENDNYTIGEFYTPVLITNDSLLPEYEGVVKRNGKLIGIRFGTVAYGFDPYTTTTTDITKNPPETTEIIERVIKKMDGKITIGQEITCKLIISENHSTNPFKHLYHPDHKKGKKITRTIRLFFSEDQKNNDPDDEKFTLTGIYKEEMIGLHKNPINIAGKFNIQQISDVNKLNDR
ncbi:MAG: hypothetical protein OMM_04169 [Candidatus Magnetoglobus multicellularis str. Araruama]|uniref:Uncharacterized protein n=1 Tax=Candidatus Magnetoglobus multicellularis str. Araruama TaxID=890399 RepID=A0A1V1P2P5_9BACT|nr:MAG: hypothetical protein OMM_04169 [Candidatus Magnetoglobus multicellularis str. Araruama]